MSRLAEDIASSSRATAALAASAGRPAWQAMSAQETLRHVASTSAGLSGAEAATRLASDGPNALREVRGESLLSIIGAQLRTVISALLLAAVVLTVIVGEIGDAVTIGAVLVLNAAIGTWIELRARHAIRALLALDVPRAIALRDGRSESLPARELVVGDVIVLEEGQHVPADARLLQSLELRTNEAALTGEAAPVAKDALATLQANLPLAKRCTLVFKGTTVAGGRAQAVVVATGPATEVGRIGELVASVGHTDTPFERELNSLGRRLAVAAIVGAVLVIALQWNHVGSRIELIQTAVAVAVAAIPEGLTAVATIAMALGVRRMAQQHAVVRHLHTLETLGAVTVVCSDKTGTLTLGRLSATTLWVPEREIALATACAGDDRGASALLDDGQVQTALRALVLSSRIEHSSTVHGDPFDSAVLSVAEECGLDVPALRSTWQEVSEIPFSSARMFMSVVHRSPAGTLRVHVKGAPSVVLARCDFVAEADGVVPLTDTSRERLLAHNGSLAQRGLRVLAVATGVADEVSDGDPAGLTFLGFIGLTDPPVPGAREVLRRLRRAGVHVVMLTGDQRATAVAIANALGMAQDGSRALDGDAVERMSDTELVDAVSKLTVVSRITPAAKLRIVQALQRRGEVVAMLGDGVNDAPALKRADVGVTMGRRGTDLAKEVAGVVLQDDRFETISVAVEEGRRIGATVRRVVFYLVSCNMAELLVVIVAVMLGYPAPLTAVQLLWLNLLTDTAPALALAGERGERDVMARGPRVGAPIFTRSAALRATAYAAVMAIVTLAAFLVAMRAPGATIAEARTVAFFALGLTQLAHLQNAAGGSMLRRWWRSPLVAVAVAMLALQIMLFMLPPLTRLLELAPPRSVGLWGLVVVLAFIPPALGGLVRRISTRRALQSTSLPEP